MFTNKVALPVLVLAVSFSSIKAMAQDSSAHAIRAHQVDPFEAIQQLQYSLKSDPKDTAGWIVLGELAQELAQDLSSTEDEPY
jgi:cytochrome c-type biogenesis protein CcmH/NrfG